ncbi:hypothetical protein [Nocardioides sp. Root140]|uniref:hypothetical protein n=1 Tax=Nocardioides sp. Root140 TaxID=1736460 RepID=UPI0006F39BB2|nr:hypothetical protein [Nocardioides sp. Root140]
MTRYQSLHDAANDAHSVLARVASLLEDVAAGAWDDQLTLTREEVDDLCDALSNLAELAKATRVAIGDAAGRPGAV